MDGCNVLNSVIAKTCLNRENPIEAGFYAFQRLSNIGSF